jgi:arginyl-tRNA synthetase
VGHLRSTVIGDALARVLEARGHRVIRQNHLGDWGTPFGMLIEHLIDLGQGESTSVISIEDLDGFYRAARAKFDGDPVFADRARNRVVALQGGDALSLALWKKLCDESRRYFGAVYARLGITLGDADVAGESSYNPVLVDVIRELTDKGLVTESDGALCVFAPGFVGKTGEPLPLIIRKQDGGYGYGTTDLAAIRHRLQVLGATRLAYVIGSPQSQHLAMVFAIAKLAGWLAPPARAEHVAFGSILGPDRKMFKTRSGDTVKLAALLDEADERSLKVVVEKNPDLGKEQQFEIAHAVAVGAIKYADLSSDRIKDYVFDWDRMLALEGNTGPYLVYAHARSRSILAKADAADLGGPFHVAAPAERALALELIGFGAAVGNVEATLEPHHLSTYLYGLASSYSSFFVSCPVLKADTEEARRSRLALCDLTAKTLARGLRLLGIEAPDRM